MLNELVVTINRRSIRTPDHSAQWYVYHLALLHFIPLLVLTKSWGYCIISLRSFKSQRLAVLADMPDYVVGVTKGVMPTVSFTCLDDHIGSGVIGH